MQLFFQRNQPAFS